MSAFHKHALRPGYRLSEYTIESILGHGGFGITYLAHDTALGAQVAIKEYLPHEIANRENKTAVLPNPTREAVRDYHIGLKNFVKEARALARFKHPHIVRVLRFFEANGTAYMVMEYEEGQSLADYLRRNRNRLDEPTLLRIFIPILNGLHAVHETNMLHLDIKPENIYLRKDESPMLIDFGSARKAVSGTNLQKVALTHGYAPVEQYPDKGKPGPWTDVYAMGASMYRCITGKKPDDALDRYQAVLKYQVDPLVSAVKAGRNDYQRHVLESVDWAMQIYDRDRPQSARELQDALMGKARSARLSSSTSQPASLNRSTAAPKRSVAPAPQRKEKDPHAAAVAWMAFGLLLASFAVLGFVYWSDIKTYWEGTENKSAAVTPTPASTPAFIQAPEKAAPTNADKPAASSPITPSEKTTPAVSAKQKISSEKSASASPALRASPPTALPALLVNTLGGHQDWVQSVAFSSDGKWLASGSVDKTIKLWVTATGSLLGTLRQNAAVNAVAISPNDTWIASAGDDGTVRLWESRSGKLLGVLSGPEYAVYSVAFSANAKFLAAAGKDRTVFVWEVESGKRVHTLEGHTAEVYALGFSPNGKYLASAGADKTLRIWNMADGKEIFDHPGHKDKILSLAYSPDGKWLATGDAGQAIRIWDAATAEHVRTLGDNPTVLSLAFSPDSRWLAAGLAGKKIQLFETATGNAMQTLTGHEDYVQSVAFSADGKWFASASRDKTIKLWKGK
ncbi:MAG: protein kinase [Gammaproteobacteria bacterium]|nr:protein kinase [Gammaproteobacteria bacterium]